MGPGLISAAGGKFVGRGHKGTSTPCQDAVAIKLARGIGCIALADGAGSRKYSDRGAQLCVDTVVLYLTKQFDYLLELSRTRPELVSDMVLQVVLVALHRYVRRKKYGIDDLACTLLFAAFKDGKVLAGHLGDGVIGIQNGDEVSVLSLPDNGEYANSTYFVTDKQSKSRLRIYHIDRSDKVGVMLMSDGTAESLFSRSTGELAPAAATIFDWARRLSRKKLGDVLEQNLEHVFRTKTTDDCSIAILVSR